MSDPSKILNSTELLVEEATRRGISTTSFSDIDQNVHVFELNGHREPIHFTRTDHGGAATHRLTNNKIICTRILRQAGYPVPEDLITNDLAEAEDFLKRHQQVVVKPISNTGGSGITTDVTTPAQLKDSFEEAREVADEQRLSVHRGHCHLTLVLTRWHYLLCGDRKCSFGQGERDLDCRIAESECLGVYSGSAQGHGHSLHRFGRLVNAVEPCRDRAIVLEHDRQWSSQCRQEGTDLEQGQF